MFQRLQAGDLQVEGSELSEDDQLGVHIGHVARFYGPFHHDVQSKGDRHMVGTASLFIHAGDVSVNQPNRMYPMSVDAVFK